MSDKDFVVKNGIVVGTTATINGVEIDPSGASSSQVLKFNGTKFVPASGGVTVSSSAPASPGTGDLWFDSETAYTFIYYDSQWIEIGAFASSIDSSTAQTNDVLKYDGIKFVPSPEGVFDDNILLINNASDSVPSNNAGIEVERGSSNNVSIRWNESTDVWEFTNNGSTYQELAKTTAIVSATAPSSPNEGQLWFDSAEGGTYVYYGSTWIEVGAAPVDTLLSTINAKGDILAGTADNTVNRLAVGSNGQLLAANSSTSTGLEWQTPNYASTGKAIAMSIVFGG